jgi:hypothetical protein
MVVVGAEDSDAEDLDADEVITILNRPIQQR